MDFLKSQLDRIQQQLAGLNASQKMLATCLVAIIVMTVMWWGSYAGRSEMAPLFQEALEPDEALRIVQQLSARGIKAEVGAENRVSVPAADLHRAFAELAVSESMPKDPSIDFDSFMKGLNPFASQKMGNAHLINFKAARLAEVIRQFPGVKGADVFIDATDKFAFNGAAVHPSATVSIKVKDPKQFSQQLVDGAASMVLGAHAGLEWNHVTVMVNGSPRRVTDPETRGLDTPGLLATREDYQEKYAARVEKLLMIRGLSVSVTFGVNDETVRRKSRIYDKEKTLSKEVEIQEKTKESTGGAGAPAGEPGAQPNVGMSIAGGAGGGESSYTETDTKTKLEVLPSVVDEDMVKTAGLSDPTGAAVMVPRSHVVAVLKHGKQNPPEPDDQQIEAWFAKELPGLQKMVKTAVGLTSEDQVSMALYTDLIPPQPAGDPGLVQPVGLSGSLTAMAGMHSREIVLGGLAVVSLFMVSMMVRKSSPAPVAVAASVPPPMGVMPVLDASEVLAGEVSEGKSMLDAMELDEDAVRAQQMVEQVSSMVEENPDAAASLVKRWMSRT
jgi:flagellar biosynthesis/type III secretory pathway M-ring protein FliF/YscJ